MQFWRLPPVLVVGFKRFSQDRRHKDTRLVKYPTIDFDITPFMSSLQLHPSKCTKYKLQCVINHTGNMHGGHYFTYCLNEDTDKWYEFNDRDVKQIHDTRVVTSHAYLLFYTRQDLINFNQ